VPENAISEPALRVTSNAAGLSCFRHSSSLLTILGTFTISCRAPASENSTIRTIFDCPTRAAPASTVSGLWQGILPVPPSAILSLLHEYDVRPGRHRQWEGNFLQDDWGKLAGFRSINFIRLSI
jgi:hypothetical protein